MLKNNIKITIIIASYNCVGTIENALQSVANQTYKNIELIIIDGASTDGTIDIIRKYQEIITYWISEPDKGIYDAWNKGLYNSSGEWISFLGADDILMEKCIEKYVLEILKNDKTINYISSKISKVKKDLSPIDIRGKKWDSDMKKYCCIAHVGSLHHKSLFQQKGNFDTSFKITGDYDFLLRCYDIVNACFIPEITAKVREGGISDTEILNIARETKIAKLKNNSRSRFMCQIDYYLAIIKFRIKHYFSLR